MDEACLKLADASHVLPDAITSVQIDLLAILIASGARVAQVASHDLVASHHDISTSIIPGNISTVALIVRDLIVWCENGLKLLALEADRLDQTMTIATVGDVRCCCLLS